MLVLEYLYQIDEQGIVYSFIFVLTIDQIPRANSRPPICYRTHVAVITIQKRGVLGDARESPPLSRAIAVGPESVTQNQSRAARLTISRTLRQLNVSAF